MQIVGIIFVVTGPVLGMAATILGVYLSFSAMETAETQGIGPVGDGIRFALISSIAGILAVIAGVLLIIFGRTRTI